MPVSTYKDSKGCYAQWGGSGAKYYYPCGNTAAMNKAKQKAHIQGVAAKGAGYKGEGNMTAMEIAFKKTMREKQKELKTKNWTEADYHAHDTWFHITEEEKANRNKSGGSNVGKYKGVKSFCGPSGGAPAGTFPVNTRKRAIAALAYARNAPKPEGIKACVCRKYPDLDACKKKKKESYEGGWYRTSGGKWMKSKSILKR